MSSMNTVLELAEKLVIFLQKNQLTEIEACYDGIKVSMKKHIVPALAEPTVINTVLGIPVLSPTIGVFYAKPSPDEPAYVNLNMRVKKGQVIALVESMKVFQAIYAPCTGIITSIAVQHGHSVEHHQLLMLIQSEE